MKVDEKMSNTSRLINELHDIAALDQALRYQLQQCEKTLNSLFNRREKIIRLINNKKWDQDQYLLDDLQQKLADTIELLDEFAPMDDFLNKFIAA